MELYIVSKDGRNSKGFNIKVVKALIQNTELKKRLRKKMRRSLNVVLPKKAADKLDGEKGKQEHAG